MSRPSTHDLRHAAAAWLVQFKATIPHTREVQVCERIRPEFTDGSIVVTGLEDRYHHLLQPLPLGGGGAAMREGADGELLLTRRLLDAAPWLEPAIRLIDRQLRVQLWAGRPWVRFRPMLLVGPPGCGKSHLARLIAEASGLGHATLDLGGVSDNRTLEGTARGWTNAQPCFPAVVIDTTRCPNPVITLEEVDKAGGSARNGNPRATMLTMIEASTARTYFDKCLLAPVDQPRQLASDREQRRPAACGATLQADRGGGRRARARAVRPAAGQLGPLVGRAVGDATRHAA